MKIAIVHYWLLHMRGGEKVLEKMCELFPHAHIYTHVLDLDNVSDNIRRHEIKTTFISKLPLAKKHYQKYLPFMPLALEELDLTEYDIVISSESGPAKGVITRPDALHICYCHTPMRYLWDQYSFYKSSAGWLTSRLMPALTHYLRSWDVISSSRVDAFVANSNLVSRRIEKFYRRTSCVIHPPCAVHEFVPVSIDELDDYYLAVGQLVKYKRFDLVVDAFIKSGKKLVVIGEGEEKEKLERRATKNISFLGRASFDVLKAHYSRCRALVFPGEEDFGIVPVEAMASGRPVIAYGRGGVLDSVVDKKTGLFFYEQTVEALEDALERFERSEGSFDSTQISRHAAQFSEGNFKSKFGNFVRQECERRSLNFKFDFDLSEMG